MTMFRTLLAVVAILSLSACVTEKKRLFTAEASPEQALRTRVELARRYIGDGNWEDAKRNLKIAAEIDPQAPSVYEAFALVYQSTGEYELAEDNFKRAIALRKPFSLARNNYAALLYSQGRYQEAEDQLEVVIKDTLYESRPRAFINLGLSREQLGDFEGARQALTRALTMDRTNRLAMLELAYVEFELGDWHRAERHLEIYKTLVRRQSPRALWLGVRLAQELGDKNALASRALALRNLFPESAEYQAYERALQRGEL